MRRWHLRISSWRFWFIQLRLRHLGGTMPVQEWETIPFGYWTSWGAYWSMMGRLERSSLTHEFRVRRQDQLEEL